MTNLPIESPKSTQPSRSDSGSWSSLPFVWQRWRQFRCAVRTFGLHELQLDSGCCRHCGRPWRFLYSAGVDKQ
jgi:hypothetical protein